MDALSFRDMVIIGGSLVGLFTGCFTAIGFFIRSILISYIAALEKDLQTSIKLHTHSIEVSIEKLERRFDRHLNHVNELKND